MLTFYTGEANHTYNLAQSEESLDLLFHLGLNHFPGNYSDMEQAIYDQYPGTFIYIILQLILLQGISRQIQVVSKDRFTLINILGITRNILQQKLFYFFS